jgi:hypothetical protein
MNQEASIEIKPHELSLRMHWVKFVVVVLASIGLCVGFISTVSLKVVPVMMNSHNDERYLQIARFDGYIQENVINQKRLEVQIAENKIEYLSRMSNLDSKLDALQKQQTEDTRMVLRELSRIRTP